MDATAAAAEPGMWPMLPKWEGGGAAARVACGQGAGAATGVAKEGDTQHSVCGPYTACAKENRQGKGGGSERGSKAIDSMKLSWHRLWHFAFVTPLKKPQGG
eukprot:1141469-Pelagomonas_calceolata.AAC.11